MSSAVLLSDGRIVVTGFLDDPIQIFGKRKCHDTNFFHLIILRIWFKNISDHVKCYYYSNIINNISLE